MQFKIKVKQQQQNQEQTESKQRWQQLNWESTGSNCWKSQVFSLWPKTSKKEPRCTLNVREFQRKEAAMNKTLWCVTISLASEVWMSCGRSVYIFMWVYCSCIDADQNTCHSTVDWYEFMQGKGSYIQGGWEPELAVHRKQHQKLPVNLVGRNNGRKYGFKLCVKEVIKYY